MKHTKGPWIVRTIEREIYIAGDNGAICEHVRSDRDAALISAAPELLEDLESLLSQLIKEDSLKTTPEERLSWAVMSEIDRCQQTIAKAKGDA
jgi:hypothetical protein